MKPKFNNYNKKTDKLAEKLNISDEIEDIELEEVPEITSDLHSEEDLEKDYAILRQKIQKILIRSDEVLDNVTKLVKISPTPGAVASFSDLIKNISDSSKMLLEVHKEITNIKEKKVKISQMEKELNNSSKDEKDNVTNLREIMSLIKGGK